MLLVTNSCDVDFCSHESWIQILTLIAFEYFFLVPFPVTCSNVFKHMESVAHGFYNRSRICVYLSDHIFDFLCGMGHILRDPSCLPVGTLSFFFFFFLNFFMGICNDFVSLFSGMTYLGQDGSLVLGVFSSWACPTLVIICCFSFTCPKYLMAVSSGQVIFPF